MAGRSARCWRCTGEEQPYLRALPVTGFRYFSPETRTVDDAGLVQVKGRYYAANPAPPHSEVGVRIYAQEIEILDNRGDVLRRHAKLAQKGQFAIEEGDRIFNPSRETVRLLEKASKIGPKTAQLAQTIFARLGRPGQKAIYGLTNLPRTYTCADIEATVSRFVEAGCISYQAIKQALERQAATSDTPVLSQDGPAIRAIAEYQSFWEAHALAEQATEGADGHVHP